MTDQTLEERLDDMLLRHGAEQGELHYSLRSEIIALIRDEKLALMERVDKEVIGEDEDWRIPKTQNQADQVVGGNKLRGKQRTALAAIKDEIGGEE